MPAKICFRKLAIILIFFITVCKKSVHTSHYKDDALFIYPGTIQSEKELPVCTEYAVCGIVHNRFWSLPMVRRFCRCETDVCSSTWSDTFDNNTMPLDNRSQLKICKSVTELPNCIQNKTLLLTMEYETENDVVHIKTKSNCYCPPHMTWVSHQTEFRDFGNGTTHSINSYRCSEFEICWKNDFCGFVRADTYSTYYRCACPVGHLCIHTDKKILNVTLPFFTGEAYKAQCTEIPLLKQKSLAKL